MKNVDEENQKEILLMDYIDEFDEVPDVGDLLLERKLLKERIDYLERSNDRREDSIVDYRQEILGLELKQQKFVKYLEEGIESFEGNGVSCCETKPLLEVILEKYKEIIGVKE